MTFLATPDRAVIRLTGDDRRAFLQGLITQDIERLAPGAAIFTALLTPQGKILFDFIIADDGDAFFIDCDKDAASALANRLMLYKLRAKISIEIGENLAVVFSETEISAPGAVAYRDPRLADLGWRAIVGAQAVGEIADHDEMRIALGVPAFSKDFSSDELFLLDVNYDALNAVSYQKGCFVGQEVTSRMKRKGEARKRTLIAEFDGAPPTKGTPIMAGSSTIGEILSGAEGRALALTRLDRWEKAKAEGQALICDGRPLQLLVPDYIKQS